MIKYSFIIPVKEINDYIQETVAAILKISRDDYEIIIYPDVATSDVWLKTRQIATGHVGPAQKRSLAINDAASEILVFVDDDAYPQADFLDKLDDDFSSAEVVAVGGPAITPASDGFWQKVSGAVFLSKLSGGFPERYAAVGVKHFVDDWPSVNLSVRKTDFSAVGGFDSVYWPGEDTKLCIDLIKKAKGKILYDPALICFHHRRDGFFRHLKQIGNYGLHRGFFVKKFPQTSLKLKYFFPGFFLLFVLVGALFSLYSPFFLKLYILGWLVYVLILVKALLEISKYEKNWSILLNSLYYIFFTHIFYGIRFIQGLIFTRDLKSKLR
ncbi:MAG: glycosyltransferase family 2 protein [Patescibacteria group bacterium]|jgi:GT2 family glycosyltransferase